MADHKPEIQPLPYCHPVSGSAFFDTSTVPCTFSVAANDPHLRQAEDFLNRI